MRFTIVNMNHKYEFVEKNKKYLYNGYAFMDEMNHCMIIVYGENKRDSLIQYLCKKNNYPCSSMDRTIDYESIDRGSNPLRGTKKKL